MFVGYAVILPLALFISVKKAYNLAIVSGNFVVYLETQGNTQWHT